MPSAKPRGFITARTRVLRRSSKVWCSAVSPAMMRHSARPLNVESSSATQYAPRDAKIHAAFVFATAGMLVAVSGVAAVYPDKPMRLVVGYPPGGANDLVGRHVARKLSDLLNSPVVVDNR